MRGEARVFARIMKVDEERRLVYGRAAEDNIPDRADEVFDYDSSKPNFMKWSAETFRDSNGLSYGNVRAMHGNVAAGRLDSIEFDDIGKAIDVTAHIVDNNEWDKVMKGVYTGFSIGGKYDNKWTALVDGRKVTRYTASPAEVSIVDRPCIPTARFFNIMKADGTIMLKAFKSQGVQSGDKGRTIEDPNDDNENTDDKDGLGDANGAGLKAPAKQTKKAQPSTVKNPRRMDPTEAEVNEPDGTTGKVTKEFTQSPSATEGITSYGTRTRKARKVARITLKKGMAGVAYLAGLIRDLEAFSEARDLEKADESVYNSVDEAIAVLSRTLNDSVLEDDIRKNAGDNEDMTKALGLMLGLDLEKRGARNSSSDLKLIQDVHNASCSLGAKCDSVSTLKADGNQLHEDNDMSKAMGKGGVETEAPKRGASVNQLSTDLKSRNSANTEADEEEGTLDGDDTHEADDANDDEYHTKGDGESKEEVVVPSSKKAKKGVKKEMEMAHKADGSDDEDPITKGDLKKMVATGVVEALQALGVLPSKEQVAEMQKANGMHSTNLGDGQQQERKQPVLKVVGKGGETEDLNDPDQLMKTVKPIPDGREVNKAASLMKAVHSRGPTDRITNF